MKKVLSLALILSLGIAGFAQTRQMVPSGKAKLSPKVAIGNEKATETSPLQNVTKGTALPSRAWHNETLDEYEVMINSYDLQSNAIISNRIASFGDGTLATVATFMPGDKSPYNQASAYRGTGYNYFDGSEFGEQPEARIESSLTGWPSIAPYGPNGEIIVCHTGSGLVYYTRENKGEGEWVGPREIPNPDGHPTINESDVLELTWPRVGTTGPDHSVINVISSTQNSTGSGDDVVLEYHTFLSRSTDGENWTTVPMPCMPNDAINQNTADDYAIAYSGNNIAVLFTSAYNYGGGDNHGTDILLYKSKDGGQTWNTTLVWKNPIEGDWNNPFVFDTTTHDRLYMPTMGAVAMDNNGTCHVALTAEAIRCGDGDGSFTYYIGFAADGVFYWKEGDEPFTTGPTFAENGYSDNYKALCPYDLYYLGVDEDNDGYEDYYIAYNDRYLAGMPMAQYGEDTENPDYYWDYVTLQRFIESKTEDELENEPIYFTEYFDGYSNWSNHLYQGSGSYQTYNGNYASKIGAGTLCGWPSITVDDNGIVAVAYNVPDFRRDYDGMGFAYRGIYVTYIDHGVVYPHADWLAEDFMHQVEEMTNLHALPNSFGDRQFVFSYMGDPTIGWAGAQASSESDPPAHAPAENTHFVVVITPDALIDEVKEAVNPMNSVSVRPNPASETLYIDINSNQKTDMTATVYNITGQKVMEQNLSAIAMGVNTRSLNVSSLTSGIYFVTVKANGFEETMKFVVK